jgi:hypothetical protein
MTDLDIVRLRMSILESFVQRVRLLLFDQLLDVADHRLENVVENIPIEYQFL